MSPAQILCVGLPPERWGLPAITAGPGRDFNLRKEKYCETHLLGESWSYGVSHGVSPVGTGLSSSLYGICLQMQNLTHGGVTGTGVQPS